MTLTSIGKERCRHRLERQWNETKTCIVLDGRSLPAVFCLGPGGFTLAPTWCLLMRQPRLPLPFPKVMDRLQKPPASVAPVTDER